MTTLRRARCVVFAWLVGGLIVPAFRALAEDEPIAIVGARILPVAGDPIPAGVLIVRGGQIVSVGPVDSTPIPAGARRVDAAGKTVMPGLVDTHSHVGGVGGADGSAPIQPEVRVYDSINVRD